MAKIEYSCPDRASRDHVNIRQVLYLLVQPTVVALVMSMSVVETRQTRDTSMENEHLDVSTSKENGNMAKTSDDVQKNVYK